MATCTIIALAITLSCQSKVSHNTSITTTFEGICSSSSSSSSNMHNTCSVENENNDDSNHTTTHKNSKDYGNNYSNNRNTNINVVMMNLYAMFDERVCIHQQTKLYTIE